MPTYTYTCEKCQQRFELQQKITDDPLTQCPSETCKGPIKRLISRTSFQLKGGGWYKDGY